MFGVPFQLVQPGDPNDRMVLIGATHDFDPFVYERGRSGANRACDPAMLSEELPHDRPGRSVRVASHTPRACAFATFNSKHATYLL